MLELFGEKSCKEFLSSFTCPLNIDVDNFIHNKAIEFVKQRIAITFLVTKRTKKGNVLVGYYALANRFVSISSDSFHKLSKSLQVKISKFSQYDASIDRYLLSMPLIAQLGKNYSQAALYFYLQLIFHVNVCSARLSLSDTYPFLAAEEGT